MAFPARIIPISLQQPARVVTDLRLHLCSSLYLSLLSAFAHVNTDVRVLAFLQTVASRHPYEEMVNRVYAFPFRWL